MLNKVKSIRIEPIKLQNIFISRSKVIDINGKKNYILSSKEPLHWARGS